MCSIDSESLYTNVPVAKTIENVLDTFLVIGPIQV